MNVSARLQEYCKTVEGSLVISGALLRKIDLPPDVEVQAGKPYPCEAERRR